MATNYFCFINLDLGEWVGATTKKVGSSSHASKKLHFPNSSKNAVTLFCSYIPVHMAPYRTKL